MTEALDNAQQATDELRELAHGILPSVLTKGGLRAGVEALASRMPVPVENGVAVGWLPATVEATAYFVVAEALTNVAKHARAAHAEVTARIEDGALAVHVRDDGVGGARARRERSRRARGPSCRPRRPAPGREPNRRRHDGRGSDHPRRLALGDALAGGLSPS